ncbi:MAG TPA: hydrogenase maturation nickel metallochaperone HypA [Myxococcales bacterium]|jgi:hydrogenase nickel incorporation protein HypA/HybF|nr:hydrogenase maturation nickel metallochaperone HypA [Myxococcales bacterium]
MHEYSIVQALVERAMVEARSRNAAVRRIHVSVGELAGVDAALLRTAFETFRERTACADAELELRCMPARWECPRCGRAPQPGAALRCATCSCPARLVQGDELLLERIELEVPQTVQ